MMIRNSCTIRQAVAGNALAEYGLALSLIAVLAVFCLWMLGGSLTDLLSLTTGMLNMVQAMINGTVG